MSPGIVDEAVSKNVLEAKRPKLSRGIEITTKEAGSGRGNGLSLSRPPDCKRDTDSSIALAANLRVRGCQRSGIIFKPRAPLKLTIRRLKNPDLRNPVYAGSITAEETNPAMSKYLYALYDVRMAVVMCRDRLAMTFGRESTELNDFMLADQGSDSFAAAVTGDLNAYPECRDDRYTL